MRDNKLEILKPATGRIPLYDSSIIEPLGICWTLSRAPSGKRLAPMLTNLVSLLKHDGDLDLSDVGTGLLVQTWFKTWFAELPTIIPPQRNSSYSGLQIRTSL
jgi:hypothetical protein